MSTDPQDIFDLFDELYLVEEPEFSAVKEKEKIAKPLSFQGGNKKRILFLYHDLNQLEGADKDMLHNLIVSAIKISWDDVAVLNLFENETPALDAIIAELQPQRILLWGNEQYDAANHISVEKYEVKEINGIRYLLADPISAYHNDRDLKLKLWNAIRSLLDLP